MKQTKKMMVNNSFFLALLFVILSVFFNSVGAEESGKTEGDVSRGAVSWSQNCSRCHEMRDPTEFRDDLWKPIVTHMRIRAGLTGQQQRDILAFLQASNNPRPVKVATTARSQPSESAISGKEIYDQTCVACHGTDGKGVLPGAPDFTKAGGRLSKSDEVLIQHISDGFQSSGSPMAMPAKGGNPDLTDADIRAVLKYLHESFGQ